MAHGAATAGARQEGRKAVAPCQATKDAGCTGNAQLYDRTAEEYRGAADVRVARAPSAYRAPGTSPILRRPAEAARALTVVDRSRTDVALGTGTIERSTIAVHVTTLELGGAADRGDPIWRHSVRQGSAEAGGGANGAKGTMGGLLPSMMALSPIKAGGSWEAELTPVPSPRGLSLESEPLAGRDAVPVAVGTHAGKAHGP